MIKILSISLLLLTLNINSQCILDSNNIHTFNYQGAKYEIVKENLTWVQAAACALSRGGFLAEINSQQEQDTIFSAVNSAGIMASNTSAPDGGGASYLWLGANDISNEGSWFWDGDNNGTSISQFWQGTSSGSAVGGLYSNWGNEPDNFNNQDGLGLAFTNWPLGSAGQWNDIDTSNSLYYIIEYPANTTGIDNKTGNNELLVYPNPNKGVFTIKSTLNNQLSKKSIIIYNLLGVEVMNVNAINNKGSIEINGLENGIYFIRTRDSKNIIKIMVQK